MTDKLVYAKLVYAALKDKLSMIFLLNEDEMSRRLEIDESDETLPGIVTVYALTTEGDALLEGTIAKVSSTLSELEKYITLHYSLKGKPLLKPVLLAPLFHNAGSSDFAFVVSYNETKKDHSERLKQLKKAKKETNPEVVMIKKTLTEIIDIDSTPEDVKKTLRASLNKLNAKYH